MYPFHDGAYEDFEPIFEHLVANHVNDGTSPEYTNAFVPVAEALEARADALAESDPAAASALYLRACTVLRIARFPCRSCDPCGVYPPPPDHPWPPPDHP